MWRWTSVKMSETSPSEKWGSDLNNSSWTLVLSTFAFLEWNRVSVRMFRKPRKKLFQFWHVTTHQLPFLQFAWLFSKSYPHSFPFNQFNTVYHKNQHPIMRAYKKSNHHRHYCQMNININAWIQWDAHKEFILSRYNFHLIYYSFIPSLIFAMVAQ